jgi:hypothetical protein
VECASNRSAETSPTRPEPSGDALTEKTHK